jgi:colanic acid biosynthesis glycosyl transferase WcaI
MRIQLWSYNYDPEPTGIGPVSTTLAKALRDRGHDVDVVAAHPHYPAPVWGKRRLPRREVRDGIPVLRLPLWVGRASSMERYRQELTFTLAQSLAAPMLGRPDIAVVASPSFPALAPAVAWHRLRRTPWVLWLHDILPDGAAATGLVEEGMVLKLARGLERAAYAAADRIAVLSRPFEDNLRGKGVPAGKIRLIYDPATRNPVTPPEPRGGNGDLRILSMGNIGFSQGLEPLVAAFDQAPELDASSALLKITGTGVAAEEVGRAARSERVKMLGMVSDEALEHELSAATLALVSQQYEGAEFNIPSKLMNFMAYALPIVAAVNPSSEVARLVTEAEAGWVVDSSRPESFPRLIAELRDRPSEIAERSAASLRYARAHFSVDGFAERFEALLDEVAADALSVRRTPRR